MNLRRWVMLIIRCRNYAQELNRRVAVEQALWDAAAGRRPLPDKAQCEEWARKLGVPEWAKLSSKP